MNLILLFVGIGACLTLLNSVSMRVVRRKKSSLITETVSVLIPMRDEAANVDGVIDSIQSSTNLSQWNLTVLDDASSDDTGAKLQELYVKAISGNPLPEGWLGKNWACWQLANSSDGTYLVFIDADVRVFPEAISSSITLMNQLEWDFISPYPRQIAKSFLERLIQPLLQWSWLASVPLRLAQRFRISSMTIANGQFFIVKRSAYFSVGGHESIRTEVLDDLRLARTLIDAGFKGGVAEGSDVVECRMYDNSSELINGYTKSLWNAFGGLLGTLFTIVLIFTTQVLPVILGLSGFALGWLAFMLSAFTHAVAAARTKSSTANIFLHPIASVFLILLILESLRRKKQGKLVWRERNLP